MINSSRISTQHHRQRSVHPSIYCDSTLACSTQARQWETSGQHNKAIDTQTEQALISWFTKKFQAAVQNIRFDFMSSCWFYRMVVNFSSSFFSLIECRVQSLSARNYSHKYFLEFLDWIFGVSATTIEPAYSNIMWLQRNTKTVGESWTSTRNINADIRLSIIRGISSGYCRGVDLSQIPRKKMNLLEWFPRTKEGRFLWRTHSRTHTHIHTGIHKHTFTCYWQQQ